MATAPTTVEQLHEYEERFVKEVWNERKLDAIDELFAPDYTGHWFAPGGATVDRDGLREFIKTIHGGFSDFRMDIEFIVAEDDMVTVGFVGTGTHDGTFMDIPATGVKGSTPGIMAQRIENGKAVEGYAVWDALGLLQQVGVVPEEFTLTEFLETALELTKQGFTRRTKRD